MSESTTEIPELWEMLAGFGDEICASHLLVLAYDAAGRPDAAIWSYGRAAQRIEPGKTLHLADAAVSILATPGFLTRPKVGAAALCVAHGRLLLGRATEPSSVAGLWHPPAGSVEPGESTAAAALRELREETGVTAEISGFAAVGEQLGAGRHKVVVHHYARPLGPLSALRPSPEFDLLIWADRSEVAALAANAALTPMTVDVLSRCGWLEPAPR